MITKLTRLRIDNSNSNSLFTIDAQAITNVYNESNSNLKYLYNPQTKHLVVLGDYREVLIEYFVQ